MKCKQAYIIKTLETKTLIQNSKKPKIPKQIQPQRKLSNNATPRKNATKSVFYL